MINQNELWQTWEYRKVIERIMKKTVIYTEQHKA